MEGASSAHGHGRHGAPRGRPLGEGTPHRLRVLCADEIDKFAAGFDELNAAIRAYSEKLERWQKTTIEHIRSMSAADFP